MLQQAALRPPGYLFQQPKDPAHNIKSKLNYHPPSSLQVPTLRGCLCRRAAQANQLPASPQGAWRSPQFAAAQSSCGLITWVCWAPGQGAAASQATSSWPGASGCPRHGLAPLPWLEESCAEGYQTPVPGAGSS